MDTAHRKHKTSKKVTPEKKPESVPDVVQPQDAQPAKVVEPAQSAPVSPEAMRPAESVAPATLDPLTDFKEKMSEEEQPPSNVPAKKNFMWPILFIVFIALALLAGIFIYKQGVNKGEKINIVTLTPTPTVIPQPSKAEIDLSKYQIKILNGSEIEGEARRQKDNLEEKGFTVSSIGNAENSDYAKTIIQAKKEVDQAFLDKLKSVLEESFIVGEIEELPEDAGSDAIVILGTKK